MKTIYQAITLLLLSVLTGTFSACSDFLNMTPKSQRVVKSVEDERDIMASFLWFMRNKERSQITVFGVDAYAYPKWDVGTDLSLYSGECTVTTLSSVFYNKTTGLYTDKGIKKMTWQESMEEVWNRYYRFLGPLNQIVDDIERVEGNDTDLRNRVKGEALVWRAYAYFKLLQYYAPYKDNTYGIPMYLHPSEDIGTVMPKRETQTVVFNQIITDLNTVLELLKVTPPNNWTWAYRADFVHAMLSSIYLWKAESGAAESTDWAQVEQHATAAIGQKQLAASQAELVRLFDTAPTSTASDPESAEFFLRVVDKSLLILTSEAYHWSPALKGYSTGVANEEYYSMFADNDRRKTFYFRKDPQLERQNLPGTYNDKWGLTYYAARPGMLAPGIMMPYRLAEIVLNKAEALCKMNKMEEARQVLDMFRASRYDNPAPAAQETDLLQTIRNERFKEFMFEHDMLWLECKRTERTLKRTVNGVQYTLTGNDYRYSFPIPQTELKKNHNMVQTPGWENYYQ